MVVVEVVVVDVGVVKLLQVMTMLMMSKARNQVIFLGAVVVAEVVDEVVVVKPRTQTY